MSTRHGIVSAVIATAILSLAPPHAQASGNERIIWAMSGAGGGDGQLFRIDTTTNTYSLVGQLKDPTTGMLESGWTTVAASPDGTLFFLRRFASGGVHVFSLDSNNIMTSGGIITNVMDAGSTGLAGNLDGLTAGPDSNLYLTAFDNSNTAFPRNGLFRFHPDTQTTDFVGTFATNGGPAGPNSFHTDLDFDPLTGDLIGTGFDSSGRYLPYRLNGVDVIAGNNQTFTYQDAFTIWPCSPFTPTGAPCSDGLAFDRVTGDLFTSGDFGGVALMNRNTGAFIQFVAGTGFGGSTIGADLAVQASRSLTVIQGFMTGGGSVFTASGTRVTHGFELHCDVTKGPNNLEVNFGGNRFHLESLIAAACKDDPAIRPNPPPARFDTYEGAGTGRFNGVSGATAKWKFTDAGEPSTSDFAQIEIKIGTTTVLSVSGILNSGNHQAHNE